MAEEKFTKSRMSDRLHAELLVAYRTDQGFQTDWAVNISRSGLFINCRAPLPVGSSLAIIISIPGDPTPFTMNGKVVRVKPPEDKGTTPGMGVEFVELDPSKGIRLEEFVQQLRKDLPDLVQPS